VVATLAAEKTEAAAVARMETEKQRAAETASVRAAAAWQNAEKKQVQDQHTFWRRRDESAQYQAVSTDPREYDLYES
jgi:hypothetical protein